MMGAILGRDGKFLLVQRIELNLVLFLSMSQRPGGSSASVVGQV